MSIAIAVGDARYAMVFQNWEDVLEYVLTQVPYQEQPDETAWDRMIKDMAAAESPLPDSDE